MADFKPVYDADGNLGSVQCGRTFYPPEHVEVKAWLRQQGLTLAEWLAANPAPPKPAPTWREKRAAAYREEADIPLLAESLYDSLRDGTPLLETPWGKKVQEIKTRYPKMVEVTK